VKGPYGKAGRSREHMKVLPACFVVVGDTVEEARAKSPKLDSLVDYANAIASLSIALGDDPSRLDPDGPPPDKSPESNASKSRRQRKIDLARRDNLTVRQLAQRLGGYFGPARWAHRKRLRTRWRMAIHRRLRRLHRDVPLLAADGDSDSRSIPLA
jgi:alkanesulfonate monooxygenase